MFCAMDEGPWSKEFELKLEEWHAVSIMNFQGRVGLTVSDHSTLVHRASVCRQPYSEHASAFLVP